VKKVSGGTTTVYIFSATRVIAEYDNGAAPALSTCECLYAGGPAGKMEAGSTIYYRRDYLSVRLLTECSGNPLGQRGQVPYGETWYETGTTTKIKFTSYERDSKTGNNIAMMRYGVNRLGRFNASDTQAAPSEILSHSTATGMCSTVRSA
jgi:hypothetical protein